MDRHVMQHRGSANRGEVRVKSNPGATLIASQGIHLPRWLAPVQLVVVAVWHGIKAVW
jgi:threonyl-tRNA synthetase